MKKLKIMLLSLALFAVVGGALAFKAKFQKAYCTAPVQANGTCGIACDAFTRSTTIDATESFCTTTPFQGGCLDQDQHVLTCNTTTVLVQD